ILFADLKGSTALGERLATEEVHEVISPYLQELADTVERHKGFVVKFTGDGIMALFGAPKAQGDDPQRAVRAALDMQAWMEAYGRAQEQRFGVLLQIRIGVNFGTVVAGGLR